jgi:tetratricopeptide (TPR) repeat protein
MLKSGSMNSCDAYERLRTALKSELQKHFGRIGEIESRLSRSEGYLSKFCRGDISIPVEVLLKSLELLDKDPGQFFGQALGAPSDSTLPLHELKAQVPDKALVRLERATLEVASQLVLEASGLHPSPHFEADPDPERTRQLLVSILECTGLEQRRRLRSARRYRDRHFAWAYLGAMLQLCYEDPRGAIKQVTVVGTEFLPELEDVSPAARLALHLRAILVYGFAQRVVGTFDQAALATLLALDLSRRFRLDPITGELLKVGAYVLSDHGLFDKAQVLLGEALVVFDELDDEIAVAKVQVQRGITYVHMGDYLSASRSLRKALRRLPGEEDTLRHYRLAAFHNLAIAYQQAGDLEAAHHWLDTALQTFRSEGGITWAKMLWFKGRLLHDDGNSEEALGLLEDAAVILESCDAAESLLIALDISKVLLDLGRMGEATTVARNMASLLKGLKNNRIAEAAVLEYIRTAIAAGVTRHAIGCLEDQICALNRRKQQTAHRLTTSP